MSEFDDLAATAFADLRGVFGRSYVYTSPLGQVVTASGVLVETPEIANVADLEVYGTLPVLDVSRTDFVSQPEAGAQVVVAGETYRVRRVEPHGPPAWRLTLEPAGEDTGGPSSGVRVIES